MRKRKLKLDTNGFVGTTLVITALIIAIATALLLINIETGPILNKWESVDNDSEKSYYFEMDESPKGLIKVDSETFARLNVGDDYTYMAYELQYADELVGRVE